MSPADRRRLIETPVGIQTHGTSRAWGGRTFDKVLPLTGPSHRYTGKYDNDGRAGQED